MTQSDVAQSWTFRRTISWVAVLVFGFVLATWLRYGVIQPEAIGILCGQADAPGWCTPRQWLILGQYYEVWGWVALISAAIGLFVALPRPLLGMTLAIAALFSALALILYNTTLGALALVLTLLALLRRR